MIDSAEIERRRTVLKNINMPRYMEHYAADMEYYAEIARRRRQCYERTLEASTEPAAGSGTV